jgi:hypothetical protein
MSEHAPAVSAEPAPPRRTVTYVGVIAVEILTVAALWLFGRIFSN